MYYKSFVDFSELEDIVTDIFGERKTEKTVLEKELNLAGTKREDIKVSSRGEYVIVKWKDRHDMERKHSIRTYDHHDLTKIQARYSNGLLRIVVPLKATHETIHEVKVE